MAQDAFRVCSLGLITTGKLGRTVPACLLNFLDHEPSANRKKIPCDGRRSEGRPGQTQRSSDSRGKRPATCCDVKLTGTLLRSGWLAESAGTALRFFRFFAEFSGWSWSTVRLACQPDTDLSPSSPDGLSTIVPRHPVEDSTASCCGGLTLSRRSRSRALRSGNERSGAKYNFAPAPVSAPGSALGSHRCVARHSVQCEGIQTCVHGPEKGAMRDGRVVSKSRRTSHYGSSGIGTKALNRCRTMRRNPATGCRTGRAAMAT